MSSVGRRSSQRTTPAGTSPRWRHTTVVATSERGEVRRQAFQPLAVEEQHLCAGVGERVLELGTEPPAFSGTAIAPSAIVAQKLITHSG